MKVFISSDMEGLPYTVSNEHNYPGQKLHDETRTIMTDCVIAVVEELRLAGVKRIVVADSHGPMVNLLPGRMPEGVDLVRGTPRSHSMVAGSAGCDFAIFVGYHAKPDTAMATFDHTISSAILRKLVINGVEMSEFLLNSAYLGEEGIPVAMVAGDKALLDGDVSTHAPWATRVQLKESLGRHSAVSPSMTEVSALLRIGTRKAVLAFKKHQVKLFKMKTPAQVELTFQSSAFADVAADLPGATRVRGSGVRFVSPTIGDGLNTIKLLVFAAAGVKAATE
ncbi:MAG: M55 family metallopeptidase [Thaumarchaeota archaeon]|nr:M55 family metallopeptidase [Nitrososphaerota archaeon]